MYGPRLSHCVDTSLDTMILKNWICLIWFRKCWNTIPKRELQCQILWNTLIYQNSLSPLQHQMILYLVVDLDFCVNKFSLLIILSLLIIRMDLVGWDCMVGRACEFIGAKVFVLILSFVLHRVFVLLKILPNHQIARYKSWFLLRLWTLILNISLLYFVNRSVALLLIGKNFLFISKHLFLIKFRFTQNPSFIMKLGVFTSF